MIAPRLPLAGNFALTGDGVAIGTTIRGVLSANLDPTLSGPIYGPLVVTQKIRNREAVIFEGRFFGRVSLHAPTLLRSMAMREAVIASAHRQSEDRWSVAANIKHMPRQNECFRVSSGF